MDVIQELRYEVQKIMISEEMKSDSFSLTMLDELDKVNFNPNKEEQI